MSLLSVSNGPAVHQRVAFILGQRFVKEAGVPVPVYNLAGTLYATPGGWIMLTVPNAMVRGIFKSMREPGVELPPGHGDQPFNAHISVIRKEEVEEIGGVDKITERGKQFTYTLGRLKEVEPDGWPGVEKVWFTTIHSPELQKLRRSYGLSSRPKGGEYDFHITCAVRRRGVLGRNGTRKADSD